MSPRHLKMSLRHLNLSLRHFAWRNAKVCLRHLNMSLRHFNMSLRHLKMFSWHISWKGMPCLSDILFEKKQHYSQLFSGTLPLTCLPDILTCLSDILQVPWLFRSGGNIFSTKNKWWKETKTKRDIVLSFFSKMFRETAQTAQYVWIDFQYLSKMSGKTS